MGGSTKTSHPPRSSPNRSSPSEAVRIGPNLSAHSLHLGSLSSPHRGAPRFEIPGCCAPWADPLPRMKSGAGSNPLPPFDLSILRQAQDTASSRHSRLRDQREREHTKRRKRANRHTPCAPYRLSIGQKGAIGERTDRATQRAAAPVPGNEYPPNSPSGFDGGFTTCARASSSDPVSRKEPQ